MILLELFFTFFKIGLFTFGGGYAMLPLIQEQVFAKGWIEQQQFIDFVAVSESTPGPFAVNIATYVGSEIVGLGGAVFATLGVVLPSFIIIIIVARCFLAFQKNRIIKGCMSGLKPAVVGLIGTAVISVGKTVFFEQGLSVEYLFHQRLWIAVIIFIISVIACFKRVHPIFIIIGSAIIGIILGSMGLLS